MLLYEVHIKYVEVLKMKIRLFEEKHDLLLIFWQKDIPVAKMFEIEHYVDKFRSKGTIMDMVVDSTEDSIAIRYIVQLETIDMIKNLRKEFKDLDFLQLGYSISIQNKKGL